MDFILGLSDDIYIFFNANKTIEVICSLSDFSIDSRFEFHIHWQVRYHFKKLQQMLQSSIVYSTCNVFFLLFYKNFRLFAISVRDGRCPHICLVWVCGSSLKTLTHFQGPFWQKKVPSSRDFSYIPFSKICWCSQKNRPKFKGICLLSENGTHI